MDRKPIFDTIREMLGRKLSQADVARIDDAIDRAERAAAGPGRSLGKAGADLIRSFEGCGRDLGDGTYAAYPDPGTGGEPWTIGWGATGPGIAEGVTWTRQQCDERFARDVQRYAEEVRQAIGDAATTPNQFDALVSFHYNTGAIGRATLTKLHKAGDYAAAAREFARWNRAAGRALPGLTRRRAAEAALYAQD